MSDDGKTVATQIKDKTIKIYQEVNSTYDLFQTILLSDKIGNLAFGSSQETFFISLQNGDLIIYQKAEIYESLQEIQISGKLISKISMFGDMFVVGSKDKSIYLFSKINNLYSLYQTIYVGFEVFYVKFDGDKIGVNGNSEMINIYSKVNLTF